MEERELIAYLAAIVESSDDAIISKNLDGTISSFNAAAERMFGYTAAEIIGRPVTLLIPADRQDEEKEILSRLRRGQRIDHFETVRITKNGRLIDVSLTVSPVRGASGHIIGASKIARDITESKRAAVMLAEQRAERERLLQNERAARAEAERANRVKDEFVAMVSHELRTPLNAILGWAELLVKNRDPRTLDQGLEVIARNTRLQAQLIADLLDVSRIVSGKLRLELERVNLAQVIMNGVEALHAAASDKGVELVTQLETDGPSAIADPARLQQIVWNLVSNAVKFTPTGGTVTIALRNVDGHAEITVSDTGVGIRAEFIPLLFEPFRQIDATTTRRHGGLGLGLSIAKNLTELHDGSIRASSEGEGLGATFTIELPSLEDRAAEAAPKPPPIAEPAIAASDVSLGGVTVLVVEDDRDTRELVRRLLESHRAEVVVTDNASEALELIMSCRPDILVSDIGLPDVDGYELIRRIRELNDAVAAIPAIALSAFASPQDGVRALSAGFDAHVAKPVEPSDLVFTVNNFAKLATLNRNQ